MHWSKLLDPAQLLAPLSLNAPCGADLRYDQVYDKIPELGRSEMEGLPMGVWERESKKSDWPAVTALCIETLSTRSKDMQISAWLGQALTHLHGASGAAMGWRIFSRLTVTFWSDIHPQIDDNDVELRLCSVYWFAKQTGTWLTEYLQQTAVNRNDLLIDDPKLDDDLAALKSLLEELLQLQQFMDEQLGQQAPFFHELTEPIKLRLAFSNVLHQSVEVTSTTSQQGQTSEVSPILHTLHSRDAAYAALGDIARALSKSEPHSPVPMILEVLVSWRDCQFNDLLTRMPQDKASIYELLKFFKQP